MKKYSATFCRVEHHVIKVEVEASSEAEAIELFNEKFSELEFENGKIVHAEEFIQDVEEVK